MKVSYPDLDLTCEFITDLDPSCDFIMDPVPTCQVIRNWILIGKNFQIRADPDPQH